MAAPAEKVILPLVTAVSVFPPEAVAVRVMTSAMEYTGVEIVTLLLPFGIVPVSVPLRVPPPVALDKVIVVPEVTFAGFPLGSCDWTVTEKAVPAVPVDGMVVYAS